MASTQTREPKLKITRSPGRNPCFDENLGEGMALRMMQIPGGTFTMGSPEDELDNYGDEQPQHEVSIATFFMGKYPITQAQWRFVAALTPVKTELDPDPSNFKGDNRPVEQVSWHEAVEFCQRLSRYSQKQYQLPTEAQWEYACRAGTTTPFHFGETITTELANYRGTDDKERDWSGSYGDGPKGEYRERTTPVDEFDIANAFGLCDMHGNVWEWCADHWHENYESAPIDGGAWLTADETSDRVLRGGSWSDNPRYCRSATRSDGRPDDRYNFTSVFEFAVLPRGLFSLQPVSPCALLPSCSFSGCLCRAAARFKNLNLKTLKFYYGFHIADTHEIFLWPILSVLDALIQYAKNPVVQQAQYLADKWIVPFAHLRSPSHSQPSILQL